MGVSGKDEHQHTRQIGYTSGTHKELLRRLPGIRILQQTTVDEVLRILREAALWCQTGRRLVDDVLQELKDTHRHASTLETDALALPLLLLILLRLGEGVERVRPARR